MFEVKFLSGVISWWRPEEKFRWVDIALKVICIVQEVIISKLTEKLLLSQLSIQNISYSTKEFSVNICNVLVAQFWQGQGQIVY